MGLLQGGNAMLGAHSTFAKRLAEYAFWVARRRDGKLTNAHYEFFFTTLFGIEPSFYDGKRVLDVGCGPRGSLEWASAASERVGADPLAHAYRLLGTGMHSMRYVRARAEQLPFRDGSFDVVSLINALDHVESVDDALSEVTRVAALEATLLIVVEINHPPTPTEPHRLSWETGRKITGWREIGRFAFERSGRGMLADLRDHPVPFNCPGGDGARPAILALRLERT